MIATATEPIIVAAAVIRNENKILISSRPIGKQHHGFWEFPGGKIDPNETPQSCLIRELREELNADVIPLDVIFQSEIAYKSRVRIFFLRTILRNTEELCCREGQEFRWLKLHELSDYKMLPADTALVDFLIISEKNKY